MPLSALDEPFDREDAPFLASADSNGNDDPITIHAREQAVPKVFPEKLRFRLLVILLIMILALDSGTIMSMGPLTRLYESVACRDYYALHDPSQIGAHGQVKEELCKVNEVQAEVAAIVGYMEFFDGLLSEY